MSQFKPGDKVLIEATYQVDSADTEYGRVYVKLKDGNTKIIYALLEDIHRYPTEELDRLRAYVELQLCLCQLVLVKLCGRCQALGKEKS